MRSFFAGRKTKQTEKYLDIPTMLATPEETFTFDDVAMHRDYYNTAHLPLAEHFYAEAKHESAPDAETWDLGLGNSPTGNKLEARVAVAKTEEGGLSAKAEIACGENILASHERKYDTLSSFYVREARKLGKSKGLAFRTRGNDESAILEWSRCAEYTKLYAAKTVYEVFEQDVSCRNKEISNGTVTVFLDEHNIARMLDEADKIKEEYGGQKVEGARCTGDEYHDRIQKLAEIAHGIMDGTICPDLFEHLPLKKDGTFKMDQPIPIFDGKIDRIYGEYGTGDKIMIAITAGEHVTTGYSGWRDTTPTLARLSIATRQTSKKTVPLLDENLEIQDIKTKKTYLKDDAIAAGSTYIEKSGTVYLYLGKKGNEHIYTRWTKKMQKLAASADTLADLIAAMDAEKPSLSRREHPRKFTELGETVFDAQPIPKGSLTYR